VLSFLFKRLGLAIAFDEDTLFGSLQRRIHLFGFQFQVEALPLLVNVDLGSNQELLTRVPFRIQSVLRALPY